MILSELRIHQVRSVAAAQLQLNSRFNFIVGANGSGKTSVLEALYLLSSGHSFRSREIASIIAHSQEALTVFGRSPDHETISIKKSRHAPTQIKLNQQFCSATSQLAYALPCQIVYADIFQIIDAGSAQRRSLLDWGMFHVEPSYLTVLKNYKQVLKQRNALLKQNASYRLFIPWDEQLSHWAEQLHGMRKKYFELWRNKLIDILPCLTETCCDLSYYKGWDKKEQQLSLAEVLAEQFSKDKQRQYTHYGAHHADVIIEAPYWKARQTLSRGQQKIVLIALKLAQGALINKECLYLFDDLPAELDELHQRQLIQYLLGQSSQYVITSMQPMAAQELIPATEQSHFRLDLGSVHAV
ncbi:MAG: DNA replication/repair protein RecF [Legionella sp.]|nr:MAG: DNA replication/repair protein RecF [Legionella sp.]PJD97151.1 MAG: DNA replication/repair protein RecF [Legionella sp.]